jgi:uncharacterized protein YndB with AHSA1/START domain
MKNKIKGSASVVINANSSLVWKALTKPEIIKQYFFGTDTKTEWNVGGPITFSGEYQGKSYQDKGTVLAFEKEKLLSYNYWSSMSGIEDKPENYVIVSYKLTPEAEKTRLEIVQENIPTEEMKEHSVENWKKVLAQLKTLLEEGSEIAAY